MFRSTDTNYSWQSGNIVRCNSSIIIVMELNTNHDTCNCKQYIIDNACSEFITCFGTRGVWLGG